MLDCRRLVVVLGATGVGKSRLGVDIAREFNGEIVSADSIQLYEGLDIASAKVTTEEQRNVPHHMINILDYRKEHSFSVRDYRDRALPIIDDILNRGKVPIIVGGTMYYIQSLLWPSLLDETPGAAISQKSYLSDVELPEEAKNDLHGYLRTIDPDAASKLHPSDDRKLIRAIQIFLGTGKTKTALNKLQKKDNMGDKARYDATIFHLSCDDRDVHSDRLSQRVDEMVKQGLWKEAREFIVQSRDLINGGKSTGVLQAIGYKEFLPIFSQYDTLKKTPPVDLPLDSPEMKECVESVKLHHRQYVSRQLKWIRSRILPRSLPVYKVDTSNIEYASWDILVKGPATAICKWFLVDQKPMETDPPGFTRCNVEKTEKEDIKMYYCDCCGLTMGGLDSWKNHLKSGKHRHYSRALEKSPDTDKFRCKVCNATIHGDVNEWKLHCDSAVHRKNMSLNKRRRSVSKRASNQHWLDVLDKVQGADGQQ